MIRPRVTLAAFAVSLLLVISCGGQKSAPPAGNSGVVLNAGTGALLIVFPHDPRIARADWLAQVNLNGDHDTRSLPRVPMGDLQAMMVLHIPPGTYRVTTNAYRRGNPPAIGGSLPNVEIRSGQMTILKARPLQGDPYPYFATPLEVADTVPWTLKSPNQLKDFIAQAVKETTKG